jgi:threonylcarbamoyladenosine tRNA methylthiotransferase MtaB
MLSVAFKTFGCRLNQGETDAIARAFLDAGFRVQEPSRDGDERSEGDGESLPSSGPDIVVINTCTVTSKAEQKARRIMRLALRDNPRAVLIATGCYAELDGRDISALGDRVLVVPGSRKGALVRFPAALARELEPRGDPLEAAMSALASLDGAVSDPFAEGGGGFSFRTRAMLKVQDGCDRACAYCRVRIARGKSLSLDPAEALSRARSAEASGVAELVLTGVNLSQYSGCQGGFPGLLRLLAEGTERIAFRVSSYEPEGLGPEFAAAAAHPRVRPYFHIPLQSGSPSVLARMGRDPDADPFLRSIESLRKAKDDPFISLDMMTGFPGETDEDFSGSLRVVRAAAPAWIHVFVFSPRPGTAAFSMLPKIPERVAVERAAVLSALARAGREAYAARWAGRETEAVVERAFGDDGRPAEAFTANGLRLSVPGPIPSFPSPGRAIRLVIGPPLEEGFDASGSPA